ncbi:hypothetical protein FPD69_21255 [Salmonella enterica subsp. enterica]|nr:hypothetical protein [Salmonella enterica subsp. enterica serovar Typhimurium]
MHPVLGTMMPEICEAPHFPIYLFHPSFGSVFNEWDAFITFLSFWHKKKQPGGCFLIMTRSRRVTFLLAGPLLRPEA